MEKEKDSKMLAIMQFIHHYDSKVSIQSLINGTSFHILLAQIPQTQYNFNVNVNMKINKSTTKWSEQLQNLQSIILKIEDYFQQVHQKYIETSNIDLIALTKREDIHEIIKLFELVMALLMQSNIKEYFVETIMMLQESSQQIFVEIVKNCLSDHNFIPSKYKSNVFNRVVTQFQEQKHIMQKQIERLCKANLDLLSKIKQYQQSANEVDLDMSRRSMDISIDEGKNVRYLQEYIDRLQSRIVEQEKIYQEERMNNNDRISDLQFKMNRLQEAEELCKIYKQKYDEIMDQMQKMNIWKRQKAKMEKALEQKDFIVVKLNDRIEQLSEKNVTLEESELQLKLELERKQLKIQKMSNQLKKVMQNMGHTGKLNESILEDQMIKQQMSMKQGEDWTGASQQQLGRLRKENEKLQKSSKQQQKQLCKMNKKMEKLRMLEQDKLKLEQLVFELRTVQSQQLNLMMAIFYEGYEEHMNLAKDMKNNSTYIQQEQPKKQKQPRKRVGGSVMFKSKENLLSSKLYK